ncbi:MAG: serine acetyltransferase [Treponema sp.]|nr:serine acetyltransferase [Treponema sp.]
MNSTDTRETIVKISSALLGQHDDFCSKNKPRVYPSSEIIVEILKGLRMALFPGYFNTSYGSKPLETWLHTLLADIHYRLLNEINAALVNYNDKEVGPDFAAQVTLSFLHQLSEIQEALYKDAEAGFNGDPAARSIDEVIITYPGFFAIFVHRIAHHLFREGVPVIPRIMSEYSHGQTGIDIHPGAQIGEYFFIDHGTGVVIGETTVIGNHVKLYQGVTLGALSTRQGQLLAGKKRHPTIEDNVTIYSGATILGGETVIGKNSTIGGNVFIIESVPAESRVRGI